MIQSTGSTTVRGVNRDAIGMRRRGIGVIVLTIGLVWMRTGVALADAAPATAPTNSPLTVPANAPATAPAAAPSAPADAAKSDDEAAKINLWDLYGKGGIFMYPLTLCSVLALAIIIERALALRRGNIVPSGLVAELKRAVPELPGGAKAALAYCEGNDSPLARILAAGIKRLGRGASAAEKAMEDAGAIETLRLRRNMRFLYALGSVATLLGLIGTISGMIIAFQHAAASGTGDVHKLSTGIYEAMVNTFAGLAVAVVVTIAYYYFLGRIERLVLLLNEAMEEFADSYDLHHAADPTAD